MEIKLELIKQAYEHFDQNHEKIIYQKNKFQNIASSAAMPKNWKKASAAQILHSIMKKQANLSTEDSASYAKIAQYVADHKKSKMGTKFIFVRNFFSRFQNLCHRMGFQTSLQINERIQQKLKSFDDKTVQNPNKQINKSKETKKASPQDLLKRKELYHQKRFAEYKAMRLGTQTPPIDVDLHGKIQGHEAQITKFYHEFKNGTEHYRRLWEKEKQEGKIPEGHIFSSGPSYHVFELTSIPGVIFKMPRMPHVNAVDRYNLTNKCRQIINDHKLDRLNIPKQEHITKLNGQAVDLLIEEKVEMGNIDRSKELYTFCCTDPDLKEDFKIDIEQLKKFIKLSNFSDAKPDNASISLSRKGFELTDLERCQGAITGLFELAQHVTPEFLPIIDEAIEKDENKANLKKVCEKAFQVHQEIEAFHQKNHVVDEKSRIEVDFSTLKFSNKEEAELARKMIDLLNSLLDQREEYPLIVQRELTLETITLIKECYGKQESWTSEHYRCIMNVLETFKNNGIFFSIENLGGYGYKLQF